MNGLLGFNNGGGGPVSQIIVDEEKVVGKRTFFVHGLVTRLLKIHAEPMLTHTLLMGVRKQELKKKISDILGSKDEKHDFKRVMVSLTSLGFFGDVFERESTKVKIPVTAFEKEVQLALAKAAFNEAQEEGEGGEKKRKSERAAEEGGKGGSVETIHQVFGRMAGIGSNGEKERDEEVMSVYERERMCGESFDDYMRKAYKKAEKDDDRTMLEEYEYEKMLEDILLYHFAPGALKVCSEAIPGHGGFKNKALTVVHQFLDFIDQYTNNSKIFEFSKRQNTRLQFNLTPIEVRDVFIQELITTVNDSPPGSLFDKILEEAVWDGDEDTEGMGIKVVRECIFGGVGLYERFLKLIKEVEENKRNNRPLFNVGFTAGKGGGARDLGGVCEKWMRDPAPGKDCGDRNCRYNHEFKNRQQIKKLNHSYNLGFSEGKMEQLAKKCCRGTWEHVGSKGKKNDYGKGSYGKGGDWYKGEKGKQGGYWGDNRWGKGSWGDNRKGDNKSSSSKKDSGSLFSRSATKKGDFLPPPRK